MKQFLTLLCLLVVFVTPTSAQVRTILAGKITNAGSQEIKLHYFTGEPAFYATTLDPEGNFNFTFKASVPVKYRLENSGEVTWLFLSPGDSVYMTLDTKQFDESVTYSGKGAYKSNFLAKRSLFFEKTLESDSFRRKHSQNVGILGENEFKQYADSITRIKLDYLNAVKKELSPDFYNYEFAEITYHNTVEKADYPVFHYYVRGITDSIGKVKEGYYDFLDKVELTNEAYLGSYYYTRFLSVYLTHATQKHFGRDSVSMMDKYSHALTIYKGAIRDKVLYDIGTNTMDNRPYPQAVAIYEKAKKEIGNKELLEQLDKRMGMLDRLRPGAIAPDFSLTDSLGRQVSLKDFRGKLVYLDFWASWCGPCMSEVPHARKLKKHFEGKEIVFLYVSIDEDKDSWINTIRKKEIEGVHLVAPGFTHEVVKLYSVRGVPTYFLVGRDGRIIDNNPSRPSDAKVYKEIESALEKY